MQAITDVNNPALTTLPLQQVHIYFPVGFLDVVLPKLTSPPYMMNMRDAPAGSPNFAQTENHYITLPDARMPHTPVCNEMYEAGLRTRQRRTASGIRTDAISSWQLLCSNLRSWNAVSTVSRPAGWWSLSLPPPPQLRKQFGC